MKYDYVIRLLEIEGENLYNSNTLGLISNKDCDDRVAELQSAIKVLKKEGEKE